MNMPSLLNTGFVLSAAPKVSCWMVLALKLVRKICFAPLKQLFCAASSVRDEGDLVAARAHRRIRCRHGSHQLEAGILATEGTRVAAASAVSELPRLGAIEVLTGRRSWEFKSPVDCEHDVATGEIQLGVVALTQALRSAGRSLDLFGMLEMHLTRA